MYAIITPLYIKKKKSICLDGYKNIKKKKGVVLVKSLTQ